MKYLPGAFFEDILPWKEALPTHTNAGTSQAYETTKFLCIKKTSLYECEYYMTDW